MYEPTKLSILQYDPTSKCGNNCGHCAENSTRNGVDFPTDDIIQLFESGLFEPYTVRRSSKPIKKINILGGGDPTYHKNLPELLLVISRYVQRINVLTGGLNPDLNLGALESSLAILRDAGIKVSFMVTQHPHGCTGQDERIKAALLVLKDLPLDKLSLNVICFPNCFIDRLAAVDRGAYPYLTSEEFMRTEFWHWARANFAIFEQARKFNPDGSPRLLSKPFLDIVFENTLLRRTGKACGLPLFLSESVTDESRVNEFLTRLRKARSDLSRVKLRLTANGLLTDCRSSTFLNLDFFAGDLYGHSFDEIAANLALSLDHMIRESDSWLNSRKKSEPGWFCDTVCRRAREAYAEDVRRFKPHRGEGKTVLKARAFA